MRSRRLPASRMPGSWEEATTCTASCTCFDASAWNCQPAQPRREHRCSPWKLSLNLSAWCSGADSPGGLPARPKRALVGQGCACQCSGPLLCSAAPVLSDWYVKAGRAARKRHVFLLRAHGLTNLLFKAEMPATQPVNDTPIASDAASYRIR